MKRIIKHIKKHKKNILIVALILIVFIIGSYMGVYFSKYSQQKGNRDVQKAIEGAATIVTFNGKAVAVKFDNKTQMEQMNLSKDVLNDKLYVVEDMAFVYLYDYSRNKMLRILAKEPVPADLLDKISNKTGIEKGKFGVIKIKDIKWLNKNFPALYGKAKVGEYIVLTNEKAWLYNYEYDKIEQELVAQKKEAKNETKK